MIFSNSVPSIASVDVTPDDPFIFNDLTCNPPGATDSDGDLVQNITQWYKDNVSQTVLQMPFEGGSSPTLTKDYGPFSNDGIVIGPQWIQDGGKFGGAYK